MIGLCNADKELKSSLSAKISIKEIGTSFPKLDGLFIDWIDTPSRKKPSEKFARQAALISYYSKKGIPIIIYDRFMCITIKESKWLHKANAFLFEPALSNRKNFEYLPYCMKLNDIKILEDEENRSIDLGYVGKKVDSLEKYYEEYKKKYPDRVVSYERTELRWKNVKFMVAIDSKRNYNIGLLNQNVTNALDNGCMVMCPIEHRYYTNMFYSNVVEDVSSIEYWMNMNSDMRIGSIMGIYDNIRKRYPEFTIEYWTNRILEVFVVGGVKW